MTRIIVRYLVFDGYNLEHIKKHNVTRGEIEKLGKDFLYHLGQYYVVSARDASKKERKDLYGKEGKNS